MSKQYIKMNSTDNHLSLGNFFRTVKELSKNKSQALQTELFCLIFNVDNINDTTINNYCVGCRSIKDDYKQIIINREKKYHQNPNEFAQTIISILSIMDSTLHIINDNQTSYINQNPNSKALAYKMYNIAKNDIRVPKSLINDLSSYIQNSKYYEALVSIIIYTSVYNKQPLYEEDIKKESIEELLNDTYMSYNGLQDYLALKFKESINYDYSMKKLAEEGNAYASFELGIEEYCGNTAGYPRYEKAFKYFEIAAKQNHAGALYIMGAMIFRGNLGTKSNSDFQEAYDYLLKAEKLGNIAAKNSIGNMYLHGIYPLSKDITKAKEHFQEAAAHNYAYAYNNLGKLCEEKKDYEHAFAYYLESANLKESWACNKVGECYRTGYMAEKNLDKAYQYYQDALESNHRTVCYYAYFNIAKYFYLNGCKELGLTKDLEKALEYLNLASTNKILPATIELFFHYINEYLSTNDKTLLDKIYLYKNTIETHKNYDETLKNIIENQIKEIKKRHTLQIDLTTLN